MYNAVLTTPHNSKERSIKIKSFLLYFEFCCILTTMRFIIVDLVDCINVEKKSIKSPELMQLKITAASLLIIENKE